jgi:hypothetical protein
MSLHDREAAGLPPSTLAMLARGRWERRLTVHGLTFGGSLGWDGEPSESHGGLTEARALRAIVI